MATVITYTYPVAGTVPPTVAQAMSANAVVCTVAMLDADTTGTITHNWQLSTAQLANLFPLLSYYVSSKGTALPIIQFVLTNSVSVTITKTTDAGGGGTYTVTLLRPHSIII